jgi:hypothetical protein
MLCQNLKGRKAGPSDVRPFHRAVGSPAKMPHAPGL